MRFLVYFGLPNKHRAPIMAGIVRTLARAGHDVHGVGERVLAVRLGDEPEIRIAKNGKYVRAAFSGDLSDKVTLVDTFEAATDEGLLVAHQRRLEIVKSLISTHNPDRIIVWNGNFHYDEAVLEAAVALGCRDRVIFAEVGWFTQRETVYFDEQGVNRKSSLRGADLPPLQAHQKHRLDQWRERYVSGSFGVSLPPPEAKTVFVPLQIDTDTNIRFGSPFTDMRSFIAFLETWIPADWTVIFKAHPKATYPYPLTSKRTNFRFRSSGNIYEYIALSELVVGINSTVLVEAMLMGKKVISFGESFYSDTGVLHEASPGDVFDPDLAVDGPLRDSFLYRLVYDRQVSIDSLIQGDCAHLHAREPFRYFDVPPAVARDVLTIQASEGNSMIQIGKSKVARSALIDVEKGGTVKIGDDCEIRHHAVLETTGRYNGTIEIGNHCVVGIGNWLQGSGRITIGDDVIVGPYVNIVSTNHMYQDVSIPVARQPLETGEVAIENDVWIGAHCTITSNVRIGAHSIIGANSFVNKDVPPYSVVAGSPAKIIKNRI